MYFYLQLIVDEEKEQQGGTVGPCLEAVVQRSICMLDALTALAAADRPPGARAMALSTGTALLRRTRQPCVNSAHVYRPLQVSFVYLLITTAIIMISSVAWLRGEGSISIVG